MLGNEIEVPSSSSWGSPSLLVDKSDKSPRFCTNYHNVNEVTKICIHFHEWKKIRLIEGLLASSSVSLDQRNFCVCNTGLYEHTVMSFELPNALLTFQLLMNMVVSGLEGGALFLDDIVIFSYTWDTHIQQIHALFERLTGACLIVNLAK